MVRDALYAWKNYFLEKVIGLFSLGGILLLLGMGWITAAEKGNLSGYTVSTAISYGNFVSQYLDTGMPTD